MVKATFNHAKNWIKHDADTYSQSVVLSGSDALSRNPVINRGDIPSGSLVAAFINTAYGTAQIHPIDTGKLTFDPITGLKKRQSQKAIVVQGLGFTEPDEEIFLDGLPAETLNEMRRGIPKHYKNPDQRRRDETEELASRFRQVALSTALGAGGGLRIGENLALRVRHFLTLQQATSWFLDDARFGNFYRGNVDVLEQASQASKGKIWIQLPKGRKERSVPLPAFLPHWNTDYRQSTRELISAVIPRFSDLDISLWEATEEESIELWRHGFIPLGYMLEQRLRELWQSTNRMKTSSLAEQINLFRDLLIFPTRNKARKTASGIPNVMFEHNWPHSVAIVEGTGTYQAQSNYAKASNPIFDYVAGIYNEYPAHRKNVKTRNGWTHHGLRHYAISSRIASGVPISLVSDHAGHKDPGFTLQRYTHAIHTGVDKNGFEY